MVPARAILSGFGSSVLLLLVSLPAWAQSAEERARKLFEEGADCVVNEDWVCACPKFEASLAVQRRPSTLLQIAICKRGDKNYREAWSLLQEARELNAEDHANYRASLEAEIKQEMARIPTLKIQVTPTPPGLVVSFDGQEVEADALGRPSPIEFGSYEVIARAPGFTTARARVVVRAEQAHTVALTLAENPPESAPAQLGTPPVTPTPSSAPLAKTKVQDGSGQRTVGLVLGGVGLMGVGIATWFGMETLGLVDQSEPYCDYPDGSCDQKGVDLRNEAHERRTAAIVAGISSAALLATGTVLYLTAAPSAEETNRTSVALRISGSGISARFRW